MISITPITTSRLVAVLDLTWMSSVVSRIYFCPDSTSSVEPAGMSTEVSILRTDDPASRNCTSATIVPVVVLQSDMPRMTVVVEDGAVYTLVYPVPIPALLAFLNVFAMFYPSAIANAVLSSTVA